MSVSTAFLNEVVHFAIIDEDRRQQKADGFLAGFLAAMHASRRAQALREIAQARGLHAPAMAATGDLFVRPEQR